MSDGRPGSGVGAAITAAGVRYRVWAPEHARIKAEIGPEDGARRLVDLEPEGDGYFGAVDPRGGPGDRYRYLIDGEKDAAPDAASRFQPKGVFGPSEVIDPAGYRWRTGKWRRPAFRGRVIYELHIGTFTPCGTFRSAVDRLEHLVRLGADTVELMPLGDFPGRWNWGYDGVMPFAPARCYGRPEDLRELVDAAHERGLAIVADVVYNHYGPVGNPLRRFSSRYFHPKADTPWGEALNFDGPESRPVRDFFVQNAVHWLDEYRFDGLRLDATHAVHDDSERSIFAEIASAARERGAFTIAEDERNRAEIVSDGPGGWNTDAVWADDFHHSVRVALTGWRESYFASYDGSVRELADILENGWLYRGRNYPHWKRPRGTPCAHLPPERFVHCVSNHDQVGNRPLGERLCAGCAAAGYRAASVLLCLSPFTPMLFMGQEWAASTPFPFFCDHPGEIGERIAEWRRKEFAAQSSPPDPGVLARMPDPQAEGTFRASQLRWDEPIQPGHREVLELYRAALAVRVGHPHFRNPARGIWTAKPVGQALAVRWSPPEGDWLLLVRLTKGLPDSVCDPVAEPHAGRRWETALHSEDSRFGGEAAPAGAPDSGSLPVPATPAAWLLRER
ncbi:MAG: malto-oligosyltrehalose trehalohydrolase [Opitutaceae bacterium]